MALPAFQEMLLPLLRRAGDGADHRLTLLAPLVAQDLKLKPDDLAELLPSNGQSRYRNRLAWAKKYLSGGEAVGDGTAWQLPRH